MTAPLPPVYLPPDMAAALQAGVNWAFEEGTLGQALASFARLEAKTVRRVHGGLAAVATCLDEAARVQVSDRATELKARVVFDLRCAVKALAACMTGSAVPSSVRAQRAPVVVQVDFSRLDRKRRDAGERDDDDEPVPVPTIMDEGQDGNPWDGGPDHA